MTLLLESVSGVDKASVSFETQSAQLRAHGALCTSTETQTELIQTLERAHYGGVVTIVQSR